MPIPVTICSTTMGGSCSVCVRVSGSCISLMATVPIRAWSQESMVFPALMPGGKPVSSFMI